jgi:hypothetical protein
VRVLHYRIHNLPEGLYDRIEADFEALGKAREWRCDPPWVAGRRSQGLFEMEYFRHLVAAEGEDISLAGFLKLNHDETDALVMTLFLRDLSQEHGIRTSLRDEHHPLAKLRYLEFRAGRLPSGNSLEEMLARRPVIKKVDGQAIMFYPPSYRPHSQAPPGPTRWGYSLFGMRAYAPSLLEAEQEALKILRGLRHLGR